MNKPYVIKGYQRFQVETGRQKVLEILFKFSDKEFSLSDLAKKAGVAKANIGNILNELESAGFLSIEKLAKIWRIKANGANLGFLRNKRI